MTKLILVGVNPKTRNIIPWDSDAEIWTLNESPVNKWMKRYDVLFQLHPRWDWERNNNMADPNHPLFIKKLTGACLFCGGTGEAMKDGKSEPCPWCEDGIYTPPEHRDGKTIIMQDVNADVPGCKRLPIQTMVEYFCHNDVPYFTSTFAHMLTYAFYESKYTEIDIYGFEMESGTEYMHQRACAEYWIGYGRAMDVNINAPGAGILKGAHYAYETNVQGYRTRLELRVEHLKDQLRKAEGEAMISEGALQAVTPFKSIPEVTPAFDIHFDEHFKRKGFVSFIRGAIRETENLIRMYDAYNVDGSEKPSDAAQLLGLMYELG
jgi:hypothetical protein